MGESEKEHNDNTRLSKFNGLCRVTVLKKIIRTEVEVKGVNWGDVRNLNIRWPPNNIPNINAYKRKSTTYLHTLSPRIIIRQES